MVVFMTILYYTMRIMQTFRRLTVEKKSCRRLYWRLILKIRCFVVESQPLANCVVFSFNVLYEATMKRTVTIKVQKCVLGFNEYACKLLSQNMILKIVIFLYIHRSTRPRLIHQFCMHNTWVRLIHRCGSYTDFIFKNGTI